MKQFFKYTLATITGIIILALVYGIFVTLTFVGMLSMQSAPKQVEKNSVMVVKLNGAITERADDNPFAQLVNGNAENIGLDNLLAAIKNAKENENIKGIYLEAGTLSGATPAMVQEIRDALVDFKKSDKFIVAYGDNYSQGAYYLCSTADSLIINPEGNISWQGLATQTIYFKNLLEKVGVSMQVFKVGTYKSAVEPYILDDMSDANREQIETFSDEIWKEFNTAVAKSRKMKPEDLDSLTNQPLAFIKAAEYKKLHLVDKVAYSDAVPQVIANMMKCDKDDYNKAMVNDVASLESTTLKNPNGQTIAVYYATGEIVQEESTTNSFSAEEMIVGEKVIKDLKELADDDDIKAVVLRVNSPGGSAFASEQIWHQVKNIKAKKPIIVSMGGYAASGGYYISCAADWIVAEPTTLTGSIGIFGMFPEASELINDKLGLKFATVKTHEYGDFGDISRPMNDNERTALQAYINNGYELFTKRCADGRGISQDSIKVIGEGRVWTGVHAKKIGLVDQLGSLDDAIAVAKKKIKVDECTVKTYPEKTDFFTNLLEKAQPSSYADAELKENLGDFYLMFSSMKNIQSKDKVQAALPYYLRFNL
ncbi:MAG: signal peptide peptidase SppA [Bacteroidaceae bacterium]|nr:signal peptide peptidase SppA [Bacteroidaceae bacterium]